MTDKQPPDTEPFALDKLLVRRSFDRAAATYDRAAFLQQEIAGRLVERLDAVKLEPATIIDIGAGTGYLAALVQKRYAGSRVVVADLSSAMLQAARARLLAGGNPLDRILARVRSRFSFVVGDAESLPIADHCAELLVSNLMLQWCPDLDRALAEFRRVLAPGGLLMFTTFGPDTLKELRAAWTEVDGYTHVNAFMDMHDVGDAVIRAGFAAPVMDAETLTVTYPEVRELMRDLKAIGAHNVAAGRPRHLSGRQRMEGVRRAYEQWRRDGVLPASYEVVYGHAWADEPSARRRSPQGDVRVPLGALRRG